MENLSWKQIEDAIEDKKQINKYGDPIEGPRDNLTLEECEEVYREDPGLLYLDGAEVVK